ncbi:DUF2911 domain-containing protein [uncultured Muriicola sp.]|uniref:DUF2911 domain-containing protein n=1 Tax=uncultured Muriicola sp. TaxID=1583102 RepID=UPI002626E62C|nr:DUF2911 domain-containing protein [uncultured Muriicola sp.]
MKALKWIIGILAVLALLFYFVAMPFLRTQTKKNSPETTTTYTEGGYDLLVNYSSPSKKDRVIFGELVPYDKVWRTGANEPTRFETKTDLMIMGKTLPAGNYSLWTKPKESNWTVIFNSEIPDWGATLSSGGSEATWNPETDVLTVEVPVINMTQSQESFTISFEEYNGLFLTFAWDTTKVQVPINQ